MRFGLERNDRTKFNLSTYNVHNLQAVIDTAADRLNLIRSLRSVPLSCGLIIRYPFDHRKEIDKKLTHFKLYHACYISL